MRHPNRTHKKRWNIIEKLKKYSIKRNVPEKYSTTNFLRVNIGTATLCFASRDLAAGEEVLILLLVVVLVFVLALLVHLLILPVLIIITVTATMVMMLSTLTFLLSTLISSEASLWSYKGDSSPEFWSEHFPICGGDSQSPINLASDSPRKIHGLIIGRSLATNRKLKKS